MFSILPAHLSHFSSPFLVAFVFRHRKTCQRITEAEERLETHTYTHTQPYVFSIDSPTNASSTRPSNGPTRLRNHTHAHAHIHTPLRFCRAIDTRINTSSPRPRNCSTRLHKHTQAHTHTYRRKYIYPHKHAQARSYTQRNTQSLMFFFF